MSELSFPTCGTDMTKDEAMTAIIAATAMEELALSSIIHAEDASLQYVLGRLSESAESRGSLQEILEVNRSIKGVLDAVMRNQALLKNQLEEILEACRFSTEKPAEREADDAHRSPKSRIQLVSRHKGFLWKNGDVLPWRIQSKSGSSIQWSGSRPAVIHLAPQRKYVLSCAMDLCDPAPRADTGTIRAACTPHDAFLNVPPLSFAMRCPERTPLMLQYSAVLFPQRRTGAALSLLLHCREGLYVERAALEITEI